MQEMNVEDLLRLYRETATVAVVGASGDEHKQAHKVPKYLQDQGYRVIPVNPHGGQILRTGISLAERHHRIGRRGRCVPSG